MNYSSNLSQQFNATLLIRTWCFLAGASIWMAGVGFPIFNTHIQIGELLGIPGLALSLLYRMFPRRAFFLIIPLLIISWAFASRGETNIGYFSYYMLFILPFLWAISGFLTIETFRIVFIRGFILMGIISLGLYYAQTFYDPLALDFRNNSNFSLPPQYNRGFALLPEVSTFSALTVILGSVIFVKFMDTKRVFNFGLLVLILIALILSASTSVVIVLPIMLVTTLMVHMRLSPYLLASLIVVAIILYLGLSFFLEGIYATRGTSAINSASARFATIAGALASLTNGNFFGAGLGNNHFVYPYARDIADSLGLKFGLLPEGITSLSASRIFEEGVFGLLQLLLSLITLITLAIKRHQLTLPGKMLLTIAVGTFVISSLVSGYRGLLSSWLWIALAPALIPEKTKP